MASLPNQVTKEQVVNALEYITTNNVLLKGSTKYDLEYKGKTFPPKEVIRWAARLANIKDWQKKRFYGGDHTNEPLRKMGFIVKNRLIKDVNLNIINKYKNIVLKDNKNEIYKWNLINRYKGRPNVSAVDFASEITSINFGNLIYHNGIAVRNHIAKEFPEDYRNAFKTLFDEDLSLENRIVEFQSKVSDIYKRMGISLNHHHDERTISTYLTFKYPEKYTLYKNSIYKSYCNQLGILPENKNKKYLHYLRLVDNLISNYIIKDQQLLDIKNEFLTEESFPDTTNLLFAQDILYQVLQSTDETKDLADEYIPTEIMNKVSIPLNQILYGPPGTGKTYSMQKNYFPKFSVEESNLTRESYIEGIVADLSWWQVITVALLDIVSGKVRNIYEHEIVQIKERLSLSKTVMPTIWGQLQSHTVLHCKYVNVEKRSEPLYFVKDEKSNWSIDIEALKNTYPEAEDLLIKIKNFKPQAGKLVKNYEFITFHQSFSYEDFIEGIKPKLDEGDNELNFEIKDGIFKKLCLKAIADPDNTYAIFIDEINRGNVSAIFGELITLIESDKRIGEKNELKIKLPYSKKEFGVPSNLYIIGTMNTADRSVEALDTALRRRFSFVEMMPDINVVKNKVFLDNFKRAEIMEKINIRIEVLLDRNHTLGHSYFIKEDFKSSFKNEIIPLLQEYFYNDYSRIGLILGKGFVREKEISKVNQQNIFADFETRNEMDILKSFQLIPFDDEIFNFENALETLLM